MPTAVLEIPRAAGRPLHHLPRREATATSVLRALPCPVPDVGPERPAPEGADGASSEGTRPDGIRSLRVRDLAVGGGGATLSWTLAAHLGLLGTATGTFVVSVVSAVAVAVAGDSLRSARHLAARSAGRVRARWVHRRRR